MEDTNFLEWLQEEKPAKETEKKWSGKQEKDEERGKMNLDRALLVE